MGSFRMIKLAVTGLGLAWGAKNHLKHHVNKDKVDLEQHKVFLDQENKDSLKALADLTAHFSEIHEGTEETVDKNAVPEAALETAFEMKEQAGPEAVPKNLFEMNEEVHTVSEARLDPGKTSFFDISETDLPCKGLRKGDTIQTLTWPGCPLCHEIDSKATYPTFVRGATPSAIQTRLEQMCCSKQDPTHWCCKVLAYGGCEIFDTKECHAKPVCDNARGQLVKGRCANVPNIGYTHFVSCLDGGEEAATFNDTVESTSQHSKQGFK